MKVKHVTYSDDFQKGYRYTLTEPAGKKFDLEFKPELTPQEMLKLGVFGGAYFIGVSGGIPKDLPKSWFAGVKLAPDNEKHKEYNAYQIRASQSLAVWKKKGWIYKDDPHGWFQWYCRYYLGRRIPEEDQRQIKRWKAFTRHIAQVKKNCPPKSGTPGAKNICRPKQRQALLHWAYNSTKI